MSPIFGEDLNGTQKIFTVNNETDINTLVNNMLDGIDIGSTFSDSPVEVIGDTFIPDKFTIVYVERQTTTKKKSRSATKFSGKLRNSATNKIEQQEFEVVDDFRDQSDGEFFPFINLSSVDLTPLQIFNCIDKKNYRDSCFVYACVASGVLTNNEIHHLRSMICTRSLPNNKIIDIAKHFRVNFVVARYDSTGKH